MVLSGATIRELLCSETPLIYTLDGDSREPLPEARVEAHSVNLTIGSIIGEISLDAVAKALGPDGYDTILEGGLNPYDDRKVLDGGLVLLDLDRLDGYELEEASSGVYRVTDPGKGYTFRTHVVNDNGGTGFLLHPESYGVYQLVTQAFSALKDQQRFDRGLLDYMKQGTVGKFRKKGMKKLELEHCLGAQKLRNIKASMPSTSFTLVWTNEYVALPCDVVGELHSKSRWARMGVSAHPSSGMVNAGWEGRLVMEIKNEAYVPVKMYKGDPICAIQFLQTDRPTEGYGSGQGGSYSDGNVRL